MRSLQDFQQLVDDFTEDAVDFLFIYIREVHATDEWPVFKNNRRLEHHKNLNDRLHAAIYLRSVGLSCPLALDTMDDLAMFRFHAQPERFAVINDQSRLIWLGGRGPHFYDVNKGREFLTAQLRS